MLTKGSLITLVGAICWADELLGYSYGEGGRGCQDVVLGSFQKDVSVSFGDHETKFVTNEVIDGAEESRGCISKCAERQINVKQPEWGSLLQLDVFQELIILRNTKLSDYPQ